MNATDERNALLRAAVAAERERCANIAETTCRLHPLFADQLLQQAIATNIRNPDHPNYPARTWTSTPPTAPGWYWYRWSGHEGSEFREIVQVKEFGGKLEVSVFGSTDYCNPWVPLKEDHGEWWPVPVEEPK